MTSRFFTSRRIATLIAGAVSVASCATLTGEDAVRAPDPIAALIRNEAPPEAAATSAQDKAHQSEPRAYYGSGKFVETDSSPGVVTGTNGETVSIDLEGVSIANAAETIIGDILGGNFVVDDGVAGTITIHTTEPIAKSSVLSIFEAALAAKNTVLIEDGGVYRIVPAASAIFGPTSIAIGDESPAGAVGYGVQVVPLRYVGASEMERILKPIANPDAILRVDTSRNLLMLSGSRRELDALLEAVRLFDVDWLKGMSFALLPVRSAEPLELAQELSTIFENGESGPLAGVVRFVPNARLNAILVISTQPSYLTSAKKWIERLDNPDRADGDQLFVYNVQNRPAQELAEVLNGFFGGHAGGVSAASAVQPGFTAETIDTEPAADVGESAFGDTPVTGAPFRDRSSGSTRVVPDEANNALLIYASPSEFQKLGALLEKLDRLPHQVMIEATIAEVKLTKDLNYGLRWFFENSRNQLTFSDAASGVVAPTFPGFSYLFTGNDAQVALNAISSITDVKIVSSPTLMVLDNHSARLQVGDQVPVATQSAVSVTNPDAPIVNTVSFKDTGVILNMTPRVNDNGVVVLDISQEVSTVTSTTTSGIDSPTIQQRQMETTVAVHDGDSIALGGLIQDSKNVTSSGVPILERIPLLGEAFKSKKTAKARTELLILITPVIVRDRDEARQVTEEFRDRLDAIKPLFTTDQ